MTRHRFAFVFLAAVALPLFLMPLVRGEVFTLRDHFDYFQPLRWFTATELQAGRLPLWNPYNASGEPWLANPQTGVFYPPTWLFVVMPFAPAYVLFLLLHLVLLGCGAYRFFARDASPGAVLIGAVALMFCGPVLSLLDISNNLETLAWMPWAMFFAREGAWRRGGAALAMAFLAGEPFMAGCAAVMYVGQALACRPRLDRLKPVLHAGLVALGISAIQLFPFLEMLRNSDRAARLDPSLILMHSMSWGDWLRFILPIARGGTQQFLPQVYISVVICALALLGIRKRTWGWVLLLIVSAAMSCGPALLAQLPVTLFRYPARLVVLAAFAVIALAVHGWDRVRPQKQWLDLVIVLIVVVDLVPRAFALLESAPFRTDVVPYAKKIGAETKFLRAGAVDAEHRTAWISGYLNLYDRRFDVFTAAPVASDAYLRMHRQLLEHPSRTELARKGIGWVLTRHDLAPAFTPIAHAEGVTVYRNDMTLPMAFLNTRSPLTVHRAHARFDSSHVRVSVDAPKEGVLVVLQQRAPGWRVAIDGVETREFAINAFFRGIQITRGHHEVVWTYRPQSLFFGAMVTLVTLLMLFVKRAR